MRNFLRDDYATAFADVTNIYNANVEGGVALWELPSQFQNAYNPIIFRRSHWYFRTDEFEPAQSQKLNYVKTDEDGYKLRLMYAATSDVQITYNGGRSITIRTGKTEVDLTQPATSIQGVALGSGEPALYVSDAQNIYIVQGTPYADENFLSNGTRILYLNTEGIDTAYLDVYRADGQIGAKLSAESFAGITTFDVAAIVRTWFAEQLADDFEGIIADQRLSVQYSVKGLGGVGSIYEMVAINGVAQIGEDSARTGDIGKVLTARNSLTLYDGYPLDYSLLSDDAASTPIGWTKERAVSRIRVDQDDALAALQTETGEAILDEAYIPIYVLPAYNIPIFRRCVPEQPFYIRWINPLGGVEYFMFERRQEFRQSVKSSAVHEVYIEQPATARCNTRAYALTTDNTVVVGAEGVPDNTYTALSRMPFAPTIDWYCEALGRWIAISVDKFEGRKVSGVPQHDIEITFNLPTINTQF